MPPESVERTFFFVDLAGFSALTEAHGDAAALAVVDLFVAMAKAALGAGDEFVKSLGDAVMLASSEPASMVATVSRIWRRCEETSGFPLPRAGAHHGAAIACDADYHGSAVNTAARVAAHAAGGRFLATATVAGAARDAWLGVTDLGEYRLRNLLEPLGLFEIRLGSQETAYGVDPVCRMRVEADRAAGALTHAGRHFYFCSLNCVAAFATNPDRYPATAATGTA